MSLPDAMNVARRSALESIKENLSNDYEMNMVLRGFNLWETPDIAELREPESDDVV